MTDRELGVDGPVRDQPARARRPSRVRRARRRNDHESRSGSHLPGRRRHPLLQMLDEPAHLRGDVSAARVDDLNPRGRRIPVAKHALEAAGAQLIDALKRRKERDPETGFAPA